MTIVMNIGKRTFYIPMELDASLAGTSCNKCYTTIVISGYAEKTAKWFDSGSGFCAPCAKSMAS